MLLSPDTTYQRACFPAAWQLGSRERQALQAQLPTLTEALGRVSRSYLNTDATIGTAQLLWQRSELTEIEELEGPTLVSHFGDSSQLVTKMPATLAAYCLGALLGYPSQPSSPPTQLTAVDLAVLQPYLESLANNVLRTLFRASGQHRLLPPEAGPSTNSPRSFGLLVPLLIDGAEDSIVITVPTAAWRDELGNRTPDQQTHLQPSQLHNLPVTLQAMLPALSLSLIELRTIEAGDVVPLPQAGKMMVRLQTDGQFIAVGRAGTQGGYLSVRLLAVDGNNESETSMTQRSTDHHNFDLQLRSSETAQQVPTDRVNLESPGTIPVEIQIRLGQVVMPLGELQQLHAGAVVTLDRSLDDPVEILAGNKVVARGEIVAVEDQLGVRILQVADSEAGHLEIKQ